MKVAVMGAGLAGLSCAVLLEQYGLTPDIYEAQYKIGARFPNTEAIMNVLEYDYVVVTTGNSQEPRRQHIWETDVVSNLIGANLSGSFTPARPKSG